MDSDREKGAAMETLLWSLAELDVPIKDVMEGYGRIVGYEPTGMHANKIRDAQARRDKAFRLIAKWDEENCHFTEHDIPDSFKTAKPEKYKAMIEAMKTWTRDTGIVFLNGVMHFDYTGLDEILEYLSGDAIVPRPEAVQWKIDMYKMKGEKANV